MCTVEQFLNLWENNIQNKKGGEVITMDLGEARAFVGRGAMLASEPIPPTKEGRSNLIARISDWISVSGQLNGNSGPYEHAVSDIRKQLVARQQQIDSYNTEE